MGLQFNQKVAIGQAGTMPVYASWDFLRYLDDPRTKVMKETTDDLVIDLATKGLVLKDTQTTPHYWRVTISTTGALITTDLGTSKP